MKIFDIRNFKSIQAAVDACGEAGGTVLVPSGEWKSGAIHLRSNVNLHLENGAVIVFSDKPEDYLPVVFTRWGGWNVITIHR